ncbi:NAD-dependent epimerase/dehydratase family protein [uncultured Pontibacter sp.]|uniref:NAD-dependent epimerase/dehydratase family protein n=1 Tax=uncultured Pontibacter sp. TaxID=453356 RepID=UPI0026064D6A|nr:NAD-dependent epimerase/dehydratase family protein [uncultured Pontibacter sp.]
MAGQKILVTGSAGFIGHHLMLALRNAEHIVVGLDVLNSYYDPNLKTERLRAQGFETQRLGYNEIVQNNLGYSQYFVKLDLADEANLQQLFSKYKFDVVINLGAQAGVRHSIEHPQSYVSSNLVGFANVLECCRRHSIKHLLFASSSSVYGLNSSIPFKTSDKTDLPVSFYAATKKANEAMAHSYAHLYNLPITGMRFFTVYGPWGRPDMAYYSFAEAIATGKPIQIFNNGNMLRDFTYVDDVITSILKLLEDCPKTGATAGSTAPYKVFNIGNNKPEPLLDLVANLEQLLGKKAKLDLKPMQPGDVERTYADVDELIQATGYSPQTSLADGLAKFVAWYKEYTKQPHAAVMQA